jgi:hypothetical protein
MEFIKASYEKKNGETENILIPSDAICYLLKIPLSSKYEIIFKPSYKKDFEESANVYLEAININLSLGNVVIIPQD